MKNLTEEQIEAVIDWMNNYEQLKNTAIPIRFREDWTKQLNLSVVRNCTQKPPLGVMPKWIHDQHRQAELLAAISRYLDSGQSIPKEWITEFAGYCS